MNETSNGKGETAGMLERVRTYVVDLGRRAEELFEYYDFGFPRATIRAHVNRLAQDFDLLRDAFEMPELAARGLGSLWDHEQSVRYAAGAVMIGARFRNGMTSANAARAATAKALHAFQADLLDDLIDEGRYSFEEARALYLHSLAPMTDAEFDAAQFRTQLARLIREEQRETVDLLTSLTVRLRRLLSSSANWAALRSDFLQANERLATGQALTVFQKRESREIRMIRGWASRFPAPQADLGWQERFARSVAHGTALSLIDLCFTEERLTPSELRAHLDAWYYYDMLLTLVNNVFDVPEDADEGLVNIALMMMRGPEVLDPGLDPRTVGVTMRDYEPLLRRMAELAGRAIMSARQALDDPEAFYPFLALMIPVVMLAEPDHRGDDLLHAYLRALAPAIRDACRATAPLSATTPPGTRSSRPCFGRIASSLLCP